MPAPLQLAASEIILLWAFFSHWCLLCLYTRSQEYQGFNDCWEQPSVNDNCVHVPQLLAISGDKSDRVFQVWVGSLLSAVVGLVMHLTHFFFIIIFSTTTPMFSSLPRYTACTPRSVSDRNVWPLVEIQMITLIYSFINWLTCYAKPELPASRNHMYSTL